MGVCWLSDKDFVPRGLKDHDYDDCHQNEEDQRIYGVGACLERVKIFGKLVYLLIR